MTLSLSDLVPDKDDREPRTPIEQTHVAQDQLEIDPGEILHELSKMHMIAAWLFAHETTLLKVSVATGIDTLRLKQMMLYSQNFVSQIDYYKANPDDTPAYDPKASANIILSESLEVLHRRLANNPEDFSTGDLTRLVEMLSSRTDLGLNPKAPETNNAVTADAIKEIRESGANSTANSIPFLEEMLESRRGQKRMEHSTKVPEQVREI